MEYRDIKALATAAADARRKAVQAERAATRAAVAARTAYAAAQRIIVAADLTQEQAEQVEAIMAQDYEA